MDPRLILAYLVDRYFSSFSYQHPTMAPGAELTAEIIEVMDSYWRSYFTGDLSTWASFLPDDYKNIGSTREEIWNSKQEIVNYTQALQDQMVGMAELKNKQVQIFPYEPYFMVHELGDLYIKTDEGWSFYSPFRLSSLLHKTEQGWKILHQHGSYPDTRTEEGEAFAFQQISRENQELREAVRRRTAELEHKNRELETEAALEKVRATAMAMRKPEDMLLVCRTISGQLETLGVKNIRNIQTVIINTESKECLNYQYFSPYHTDAVEKIDYTSHPVVNEFVEEMLRSDQAFFTKVFEGKELDEWRQHRNETQQFPDPLPDKAGAVHYYFFSIGNGALGLSTYDAVSEESLQIFRRFKNVFELSYKRYLDIALAEAQARETQIEAALEKIRSRSLAMHQSKELKEVIAVFFEKLNELGVLLGTVAIQLFDHHSMDSFMWVGNTIQDPQMVCLPYDQKMMQNDTYLRDAWEAMKTGKDLINQEYTREQKDSFFDFIFLHNDFVQIPPSAREVLRQMDSHICCLIPEKNSALFTDSWNQQRYSPESVQILKRAARVFEQAYIRFLDLQKAEAQAREAEIQLALERVRAKTMAMQKSDELPEAANLLFQQVQSLGMPAWSSGYCIWDDEKRYSVTLWMSSEGVLQPPFRSTTTEDELFREMRKGAEQGKDLHIVEMGGEKLEKHYQYMRKLPVVGGILDSIIAAGHPLPSFQIMHQAYFSKGFLLFITYEPVPEAHEIFKRFAAVFDQTYTRFLDLQKAEALAREAEIELSMERIRAHAMAMKESADLLDIVVIMRHEFVRLGHEAHYFWHMRWLPDTYQKAMTSGDGTRIGMVMQLPRGFHEDRRMLDWEKAEEPVGIFTYDADGAIDYIDKMIRTGRFDVIDHNAPGPDDVRAIGGITFIMARTTHGEIGYSLPGIVPQPPADDLSTLVRFAGVFDLAYKRFEDLKTKEWQNRQSQIELALERVRSRTMAMQKSDELKEVAHELRVQLASLGTSELETCAINLYEEYNDFLEAWVALRPPDSEKDIQEFHFLLPKQGIAIIEDMLHAYSSGSEAYLFELNGKKGIQWMNTMSELVPEMYEAAAATPDFKTTGTVQAWFSCYYFPGGALIMITMTPPEEESKQIMKRCTQVFGHAYRRFADLKKAEAQAREAQIEVALEKVRARSLAMHKSEELQTVVNSVFERLKELEIEMDTSSIIIPAEDTNELVYWFTNAQGYLTGFKLPRFNNVIAEDIYQEKERGSEIFSHTYTSREKDEFWNHLFQHSEFSRLPDDRKKFILDAECFTITIAFTINTAIQVNRYYNKTFTAAETAIIRRFAIVFEQAYTRFLDLQKAEAQAREAEIELALERVRARAMAMQTSEELNALIGTVFSELIKLDLVLTRCVLMIFNPETKQARWWMANSEAPDQPMNFLVPYHENPVYLGYLQHWEERASKWVYILEGKQKTEWDDFLFGESELSQLPDFVIRGMKEPDRVYLNVSFYAFGGLTLASLEPLSDNHFDILKRFGKVFDLTYTRFSDLKLAEAQAREAKIESALERIRASALAMQKSGDLFQVAIVLREQMGVLGQPDLESSIIHLYHHDTDMLEAWFAYCPPGHPLNELVTGIASIPFNESEWSREVLSGYLSGNQDYTIVSTGDKLREWYTVLEKRVPVVVEYNEAGELIIPEILYYHFSKFGGGALLTISNQQPSVETRELQKKAAAVFDFAYTRFLDLQKAEDQAREANIETALEKVRGKAMSMQNSEDLTSTIAVFYHEIQGLGLTPRRCGVGLLNRESRIAELSTQNTTEEGSTVEIIGNLSMTGHPVLEGVYEHWIEQKEYHPVLRGNEIREYYQVLKPQIVFPDYPHDEVQYGYFFFFDEGGVYAWYDKPLEEDELNIYRRFARVIQLTYKRYLDLKNSEANALEAIRQSSLDRLRAEISSMRSKQDLEKITPLLWNELKVQGVPFIRCGVFLMDETQQLVHTFLSAPDGSAIASFHLPYGIDPNINAVVDHWRSKNIYQTHWDVQAFMEWTNTLVRHEAITAGDTYLKNFPAEGLYLCFIPFVQGMLYAGNSSELKPEHLRQMESLSSTFSAAYARYEDFIRLELAKIQVEKTLEELKLTQSQLIQAEKMASLGQLTAGIAHEIQNPLNFVNNFSDVTKELIDEMKTELKKGDVEQAVGIADDIIGNLEKILHHGKRADSIVKGMLQHSRSSSGQKEITDINALTDEYVRLAFHGFRAKDKDFTARMDTEFDTGLPKVNVVPQDIGRVILNLINNAFYAVHEKWKQKNHPSNPAYKPLVVVRTCNLRDKIEIRVKDNGNGIPVPIREKIFQPFFTTKPTGQGTGLGLSLSYDIVKAHGGEIMISTAEGNGTEFIITLPV